MVRQVQWMNISVIVTLLLLLAVGFFSLVRFFVVPIVLAAVFTTLFYPLFRLLRQRVFRGNRALSSAAACIFLIIGVFGPVYIVAHLVSLQSIEIFSSSEQWIKKALQQDISILPERLSEYPLFSQLHLDEIEWQKAIQELSKTSGRMITMVINRTSAGAFDLLAGIFLTLFTMFYFFRDGDRIIEKIRFLSPIRPCYEEMIMSHFILVSRATIKGTVIIGLTQGILGALVLSALGFNAWLLWGVVMIILSIIPIVGSYFVLVPAAIYLFLGGNIWQGSVALITATLLNYGVDYFLRPRLVGHDSKVHDLVIFFSTLGGLAMFGVMGFVVGPVIAVLFVTMINIYAKEFEPELIAAKDDEDGFCSKQEKGS